MTLSTEYMLAFRAGLLGVLEAYLDESHDFDAKRGGPWRYVIAGWLGDSPAWRLVERRWRAALRKTRNHPRVREFHAVDCRCGRNEFTGWSQEQRDSLIRGLWSILLKSDLRWAICIIHMAGRARKHADYLNAAYASILMMAVLGRQYPKGERIVFIFDEKDKVQAKVEEIRRDIREIAMRRDRPVAARIGPISFDSSSELLPLQAADLLAYEAFRAVGTGAVPEWYKALAKTPERGRTTMFRWDGTTRQYFAADLKALRWDEIGEDSLMPLTPLGAVRK